MSSLDQISGIGETSRELLEVTGFTNIHALAQADAGDLLTSLEKANQVLKIAEDLPEEKEVGSWIEEARGLVPPEEIETLKEESFVNYEATEEVQAMISEAPIALPLPAKHFVENSVAVSEIPVAIFLNRYAGDLDVRAEQQILTEPDVETSEEESESVLPIKPGYRAPVSAPQSDKIGIDISRLRSTAEFLGPTENLRTVPNAIQASPQSIIRTPLEKTNRGKTPGTRSYIRGVLLRHPLSYWFMALISLSFAALLPLAVISVALLILSDILPQTFGWISKWFLVFPALLPPVGLLYLVFYTRGSCQICRQNLFWPRLCIKNAKAHHIKGLGYIVPLSLHIILFRWFRCTYCGTSLRLKQ